MSETALMEIQEVIKIKSPVYNVKLTNKKILMAKCYIKMVADGDLRAITLLGSAGTGKSQVIKATLDELGIDYVCYGGHITMMATYLFLLENHDKLIFFDDVSQVINEVEIMEMLKQCLQTGNFTREINYRSNQLPIGIPNKFEFSGKCIFAFNTANLDNPNVQAITDRSPIVYFDFTRKELLDMMNEIANDKSDIYEVGGLNTKEKLMITKEIENYTDSTMDISLRKQEIAFNIYRNWKKDKSFDWKPMVYNLFSKRKESFIRELIKDLGGMVERKILIKEMCNRLNIGIRTAQRRVEDYLELGEIYTNKLRNGKVSLTKF